MNFEEVMDKIKKMGITQGAIERASGYYKGKITELLARRVAVREETFEEIAKGLEVLSEELAMLAEEVRNAEVYSVGQYSVYEFTFPNGKKSYLVLSVCKRRSIDSSNPNMVCNYMVHPFEDNSLKLIDDLHLEKSLSLKSLVTDLPDLNKEKSNAVSRLKNGRYEFEQYME